MPSHQDRQGSSWNLAQLSLDPYSEVKKMERFPTGPPHLYKSRIFNDMMPYEDAIKTSWERIQARYVWAWHRELRQAASNYSYG